MKIHFKAMFVVVGVLYAALCLAQVRYEGENAQAFVVSYEVGRNNNVVGEIRNPTDRTVDVTVEFKGYAADGHVIQGNPLATVRFLAPGETVRFQCAGFYERVSRVALARIRAVS